MDRRIDKKNVEDVLSLSSIQEGILFHYLKEPDGQQYVEQLSLTIDGVMDANQIKEVWRMVAKNNEMLRTIFRWRGLEKPIQIVLKEHEIPFHHIDLSHEEPQSQQVSLRKIKEVDRSKGIEISTEPFRVTLVKIQEEQWEMIITNHHILYDGWSTGVLLKEFFEFLEMTTNKLQPPKVEKNKYKEFMKWCSRRDEAKDKIFWGKYLEDFVAITSFPISPMNTESYPMQKSPLKKMYSLPQKLVVALENFCKKNHITMATLLYTSWGIMLGRYSNSKDVVFGTTLSGRPPEIKGIEDMVGLFINTIPLRMKIDTSESLKNLIHRVDEMLKERTTHEHTPLMEIQKASQLSNTQLFDNIVVIENYPIDQMLKSMEGRIKVTDFSMVEQTNYNLTFAISVFKDIELSIVYQDEFDNKMIDNMLNHYGNILTEIVTNPDKKLEEVEILSNGEGQLLLEFFNNTKLEYPREKTLHQIFEEQVERTPDQIALVYENQEFTYQQLNEKANQVARQLVQKGVKAESIVGIMVERSFEMIIGILSILKAGGAYLPIDPSYPEERVKYMMEDSGCSILLSQSWLQEEEVFDLDVEMEILFLDQVELYEGNSENLHNINSTSEDLAYIIYTSGSTGRPKGVMVQHNNAVNILSALEKDYPMSATDTYLLKTAFTFDVSVTEIFGWFFGAGRLTILKAGDEKDPRAIIEAINDHRITHINFVPSMLNVFEQSIGEKEVEKLQTLKYIFAAGEAISRELVEDLYNKLTTVQIENIYGPTETTIYVTRYSIDPDRQHHSIPIGKPMVNTKAYILDEQRRLQPMGVAGELYISGEGVTRGYINKPELTQEKFVTNPFNPEEKMYRTGDLVRWLPDGNIEYLGRIDHQVKIRGYRIELGEIESQLLKHEIIKEAVVMAKDDGDGNKYLCGYITGDDQLTIGEVKEYLSEKLPEYMIPSYIIQLDRMPLNTSGKLDRKALPQPDGNISMELEYEAPRNSTEDTLVTIWEEILGVDGIGINHNFFELGGHSLKATSLVAKIYKILNVEIPLSEIFKTPTIRGLAQFIKTTEENIYSEIKAVDEKQFYITSPAQRRIYTLQQLDKSCISYNISGGMMLLGNLEITKLEETFSKLIQRHEALRTTFEMKEGQLFQYIHQEMEWKPKYMVAAGEEEITGILENFITPFNLSKGPLMRAALVKLEEERHLLILDLHHIIADGTSIGVLLRDFAALYRGSQLEPLKIQYKDYSEWQNNLMDSGKIENQKKYWLKQLEGELPLLNLIGDYQRPTLQSFEGDQISYQIDRSLTSGLRRICKENGVTMYMVLLAAFNVLLAKYSGQEDIIVGSPIAGRPHGDLSNMMGMFVNTLAMRNYPVGEKTFQQFLEEVKKNALGAYENQDYQFEELVENLNIKRDLSRNPLFDVMFTMQNMDMEGLTIEGLSIETYKLENKISKFDITLSAIEQEEVIDIGIEYATKIFKQETMANLYRHLENILKQIIINSKIKLSEMELITGEEKTKLLDNFNNTRVDFPKDKTLHQLFEEQVERTPENIAVIIGENHLTYQELNRKSNQLARCLKDKGIRKDSIVAIMVEPSLEMIIGILAVLKAGGAFLPIDPENPQERINFMLMDSGAELLLTQSSLKDKARLEAQTISLDDHGIYQGDDININDVINPSSLAYVIYTSGSTGKPKGVMIEHKGIYNTVQARNIEYNFTNIDKALPLVSFAFDGFISSFFTPILFGGASILMKSEDRKNPIEILKEIKRCHVTHLISVPALYGGVLDVGKSQDLHSLRVVTLAGDRVTSKIITTSKALKEDLEIINEYGPTENSVVSTIGRSLNSKKVITIGKPIANTKIYILDKYNRLQPEGVAGELCLAGEGLGRGYLNRPDISSEKFVENPFQKGEVIYKTGDLGRWLPDGNIEFLGRIDHQVKIRGYRIEVGEIEEKLLGHPSILEAVVMAKMDERGISHLSGYFTGERELAISHVREFLGEELPAYMIPSFMIQLEKMPYTLNGKVDRRALPEIDANSLSTGEYVAPRNPTEKAIAEVLQGVLKVEKVGISDNFFELGGDSLKGTSVIAQLQEKLNTEIPLRELFKSPTVEGMAKYIEANVEGIYSTIEIAEEKPHYPLSSTQRRLYALQQFDQAGISYNMPGAVMLEGEIDVEKIEEVFRKLIQRHESLRTSFKMLEGELVQCIHKEVDFRLQYMKSREDDEIEEVVRGFIRAFDLSQAPLLRAGLVMLAPNRHLLVFDMHHIISDGTSMGILIREFTELYKGNSLEELKIQYKDYSLWQNELLKSEEIEGQKEYWLQQFEGEIPVLNLMGDYTRPPVQSFEGANRNYRLGEELTSKLKGVSSETGATLYMVLLAAYNILLSKYTSQEDIVVGSPIAGRPHGNLSNIIGMFVNTLPMRNFPEGEKSFRQFLGEVKENALGAFENQNYQFEDLVEALNITRDISRNPLFDVMFSMDNMESQDLSMEGLEVKPYNIQRDFSKFDIVLSAMEVKRYIDISIDYCTKIFKGVTIDAFYGHLVNILEQFTQNPDLKLKDIQLITEKEKQQIIKGFNNTKGDDPKDKTIPHIFEEQVEKTPNNIAVVFEDRSLTYGELNEKANQVARLLVDKGVKADTIVGIMVERSIEMMIGIIAILKSGGAYLPIDPTYPQGRINYMLEDSGIELLLTQCKFKNKLDFAGEILLLDGDSVWDGGGGDFCSRSHPNSLAYVIYTSGSTGKPKGVMVEHKAICNTLQARQIQYGFNPAERSLVMLSFAFDGFVTSCFAPLLSGGTALLLGEEESKNPIKIKESIIKNKVNYFITVPTMYSAIIDCVEDAMEISTLKVVTLAGEKTTPNIVKRSRELKPDLEIVNEYGPTENSVMSTISRDLKDQQLITIGKPIANTQVYIMDRYHKLQPVGVPGELQLSGAGLARGYLNRDDLTAEKFVDHPYDEGMKLYKTGDLGRWLADGRIEFLGRIDHQVKIRGYRIELGEIENHLSNFGKIEEAVVMAREDEGGNQYLCGYILSKEEVDIAELRQTLSKELPDYMIPAYIIQLEKMPLTPNGKIDRKALPEPDDKVSIGGGYEAPQNSREEALVAIWEEILGVQGIGTGHNFFDLGGHSLKAVDMVAKIHRRMGVEISLREIFSNPTIKKLGKFIEGADKQIYSQIQPAEIRPYYSQSSPQKRIFTLQQLNKNTSSYNMPFALILEGSVEIERVEAAFRKLIQRHESLRTSFKMIDEEPVQIIHQEVDFNLHNLGKQEEALEELVKKFVKPFDLSKAPLLRGGLVKINEERYFLMVDLHHIISDGISITNLIKDFSGLYSGKQLKDLKIQYKDYSQWHQQVMASGKIADQKEYWLQQFLGEIPQLNLRGDYPRPQIQQFDGYYFAEELEEEIILQLKEICKKTGATLYMLFLSAFNVLLSKYSGQEDIIVGSPMAGRPHGDLAPIIGMFVSTLAMRNYPKAGKSFKEFLQEVKGNCLRAYENQDYQFEELVENLNLTRDLSRNPLFDVMFTMQNMDRAQITMEGLSIKPYEIENNISKFDITMTVMEKEEGIDLGLAYSTHIFKRETMERFYRHYRNILLEIIKDPDIKLEDIELITEDEKQMMEKANDRQVSYQVDRTLQQLFEEQVKRSPHSIAVVKGKERLTYGELNEKSNGLARILREKGVKPNSLVGVICHPSIEMMIAILAILKAGAGYLPIDCEFPKARRDYMLKDSATEIILTTGGLVEEIKEDFIGHVLVIDEVEKASDNLPNINQPQDLIYTIYTSGTTGKGKGVMITHKNLNNYTNWFIQESQIREGDKTLLLSSFAFDLGYTILFSSILSGSELHILSKEDYLQPEKLLSYIEEHQISYMKLTPSHYRALVDSSGFGRKLHSLRLLLLGGEEIKPQDVEKTYRIYKDLVIMNHYGPTETTIGTIAQKIKREDMEDFKVTPTIGRPINNAKAYILDGFNKIQPIGVAGELCISGDGVATGYLNRPELTKEKFINHPLIGERIYKTGDLARLLSDGRIEFLGRVDHQVKIRGYRIEIGEIESRLLNHGKIKVAVVMARDDDEGNKYLVAYIVGERELSIAEVREYLGRELPEYMIPNYIIFLEELPLTPNGKIDRRALPAPAGEISTGVEFKAPRDEIEDILVEIWQEVLAVEGIGINDSFFALGGQSLKAIRVNNSIYRELGYEISVQDLFKYTTISSLAEYLLTKERSIYRGIEALPQSHYYQLSYAQKRLWIINQLEPDSSAYHMGAQILLEEEVDVPLVEKVLKIIIERHESLRTRFQMVEDETVQIIDAKVDFNLVRYDLSHLEDEEAIHQKINIERDLNKPFDLTASPLIRVALVKLKEKEYLLNCIMHHIISDGWSKDVLAKEFYQLYAGLKENQEISLEPLRIQYKDFAAWQNTILKEEKRVKAARDFWHRQLQEEIPQLNLLFNESSDGLQKKGSGYSFTISKELKDELKEMATSNNTSLYTILLTSLSMLISKMTKEEDIVIGTAGSGREHDDLKNVMGYFINTVILRNYVDWDEEFISILKSVSINTMKALQYQFYPIELVIDQLQIDYPKIPIFFNFLNMGESHQEILEDLSSEHIEGVPDVKFDIVFYIKEFENALKFKIHYNANLLYPSTIENMAEEYAILLAKIVTNPNSSINDMRQKKKKKKFK